MEEGTAHPYKDNGKVSEMSRKDLSAGLFDITDVSFKVVSVCVEVPNPGCGFGTFGEAAGPEARLPGFF
jgi:hypothetical protein